MKPTASTALKVCVFIGLCASLAECTIQPREVAQRISTVLHKRQDLACSDERLNEIFQTFPGECISILVNLTECEKQCLSVVCSDTCAQSFYDFFVECYDDQTVISGWELFCSKNKHGNFCYDSVTGLLVDAQDELLNACENSTAFSCPASCMELLQKNNDESGCCLYTFFAVAASLKETNKLWALCDVDTPGVCISRFTGDPIIDPGSGAVTVTSYIFVLVVTLLMASTSLN